MRCCANWPPCKAVEDGSNSPGEPLPERTSLKKWQQSHSLQLPIGTGDLLMWDNVAVQHKANFDYDLPLRRLMHRTTVRGSVPV